MPDAAGMPERVSGAWLLQQGRSWQGMPAGGRPVEIVGSGNLCRRGQHEWDPGVEFTWRRGASFAGCATANAGFPTTTIPTMSEQAAVAAVSLRRILTRIRTATG